MKEPDAEIDESLPSSPVCCLPWFSPNSRYSNARAEINSVSTRAMSASEDLSCFPQYDFIFLNLGTTSGCCENYHVLP